MPDHKDVQAWQSAGAFSKAGSANQQWWLLSGWLLLAITGAALWWSASLHMHTCKPGSVHAVRDPAAVSYLAMEVLIQRPKVLLFGDSLTERGWGPMGWSAGLAHHFQRRAEVVNMGLGGYNTRWALSILPDVLQGHDATSTLLATLFFGANDAALRSGNSVQQHVPIVEFKANLVKLVQAIRNKGIQRIVIITPPPVYGPGRAAWAIVKHGEAGAASMPADRTLDGTQPYAQACVEAAEELSLPVVELFHSMQETKGWGEEYLNDGLHLTPEGNQFLLARLLETLSSKYPELNPESLPIHWPPWDAVDATNPAATFQALTTLRAKGPYASMPLQRPAASANGAPQRGG